MMDPMIGRGVGKSVSVSDLTKRHVDAAAISKSTTSLGRAISYDLETRNDRDEITTVSIPHDSLDRLSTDSIRIIFHNNILSPRRSRAVMIEKLKKIPLTISVTNGQLSDASNAQSQ